MPQLVFKILVPGTEQTWRVIERVGEYNTEVTVPRIGEKVIFLDSAQKATTYLVYDIEHVYAVVLRENRLYHVVCYVGTSTPRDIEKYVIKKPPRLRAV